MGWRSDLNATLGLGLQTQQKTTPFKSTAFVINYSFISGFNYEIKITARGNPDVLLKASAVPNVTNFVTAGQTACGVDANAFNYSTAGYGQYSTAVTTTGTVYNIPAFSVPSGNSAQYLYIWSSGGLPSANLDVLNISKITITATPIVSFNLTSSVPSITCGSTTPVTFTVNNAGGTTGITGYIWNLGSASNGWLYNGSAAPATITTGATINTLTLTPVCGSALSNVNTIVSANGNNYTTNSSVISISSPILSINGLPTFCSGSSQYSIANLPCNSSVIWNTSPAGIVTPNTSTSASPTFTKIANGNVTLSATVNLCGTVQPSLTKAVRVGAYSNSDFQLFGGNAQGGNILYYCYNQNISLILSGSATAINWVLPTG